MSVSILIIYLIFFGLLLFCIIAGFLRWRKLNIIFRGLFFFIVFTFVIDATALFIELRFSEDNRFYLAYDFVNIGFVTWLYRSLLSKRFFKLIVLYCGFFLFFFLVIISLIRNYYDYDKLFACLTNMIFILFVLIFLLEKMLVPVSAVLYKQPDFVFSISLLFNSSLSILFWIIENYFTGPEYSSLKNSIFYSFLFGNYLFYIGVGAAFILADY